MVISEGQTGVTEGNDETQSRIRRAALEQRGERRRVAVGDRLLELVGAQRVDDAEDQLAARSPQRPQALVLARRAPAAGEAQVGDPGQGDEAERLQDHRQPGGGEGREGDQRRR